MISLNAAVIFFTVSVLFGHRSVLKQYLQKDRDEKTIQLKNHMQIKEYLKSYNGFNYLINY